ncbi:MAG: MFS transporter [Chloroflexota bacterium]
MQASPSRLNRTFSSLAIRNYRLFWLGQLVSLSGTWMQTTAQAWLVLKLTNSPVALGTVTVLQFLPVTLLTLFGGVLADRLPKRTVIICTQSISAVQALLLAFLVLTSLIQVWQIYIVALVLGMVSALDNPTRQAFVVEMVGPEQLQNAIALNSSLFNAARIIGPALGGVVISTVGIGQAFLLNGLSFIPVLAGLILMRPEEFFIGARAARERVFKQLGDGLRYAANTPDVLLTLIAVGVLGTFGYNFTTILPLITKYVLHGGADVLGLLTSAMGVGSLASALAVAGARRASLRRLLGAAAIFSVLLILVGLSRLLPLTIVLLLMMGVMSIIFSAGANTRLQLSTPAHLRGRVMSLYFLLFAGTTPLGAAAVGLLAERWNVQAAVVLMGVICVVGVGAAGMLARRSRTVGTPPPILG